MLTKKIDAATKVGDEAKIKHILYLYEETEKCLLDSLVERTNQRYKQDINEIRLLKLEQILEKIEIDMLDKVIPILGRLCVRNLTFD